MTVLTPRDSRRFINTYQQVAIALSKLQGNQTPPEPPQLLAEAREQLQHDPPLLDQAVALLNKRGLQADPEVIAALRQMHLGEWVHLKDLKSGSILIDRQGQQAYRVTGLTQPLGVITGTSGCLVKTGLCPFAGHILCDGIVITRCHLGSNLRRDFNDRYRSLKATGRLHHNPMTAPLWNQSIHGSEQ